MENESQNLGNLSKERRIEIILSVNEKNEKTERWLSKDHKPTTVSLGTWS